MKSGNMKRGTVSYSSSQFIGVDEQATFPGGFKISNWFQVIAERPIVFGINHIRWM
jgi:hypothetical protein